MKRYYDPEYDRMVDETVPKEQYRWFCANCRWFRKTYEEFLRDNFMDEDMIAIPPMPGDAGREEDKP